MQRAEDGGDPGPRLSPGILVEDLVAAYPALIGPLLRRGVVCIVCGEPYWGTLGDSSGPVLVDAGGAAPDAAESDGIPSATRSATRCPQAGREVSATFDHRGCEAHVGG